MGNMFNSFVATTAVFTLDSFHTPSLQYKVSDAHALAATKRCDCINLASSSPGLGAKLLSKPSSVILFILANLTLMPGCLCFACCSPSW